MQKVVLAVLALLLVATNAFWLYATFDQAVTQTYREQMLTERAGAIEDFQALVLKIKAGMTRAEVLEAIRREMPESEPFEKDGLVVGGWLVFEFDEDGGLLNVRSEVLQANYGSQPTAARTG